MSISDAIVVMKDGVVQQIGAPQDVYNDPCNLFVAKFLGTPPINVFAGTVRAGKLYLGDDCVLDVPGVADRDVIVGIRPEGFEVDAAGPMQCSLSAIEVMGRDVSVVAGHTNCQSTTFRAIVDADEVRDVSAGEIRFRLKPHKVELFDTVTEERIGF